MSATGKAAATPLPVLQTGQTTFVGRAFAWLGGEISAGWSAISEFINHKMVPELRPLLKHIALDEWADVKPIVDAKAKEFEADIPLVFTQPGKLLDLIAGLGNAIYSEVKALGLPIAEATISAYAQAKIHAMADAHLAANPGAAG